MSGRHRTHRGGCALCYSSPHVTPEAAGAGRRLAGLQSPEGRAAPEAGRAWRTSWARRRARAWRRRRMRPAKGAGNRGLLRVPVPPLPLHSSLGLVASTSPSTLGTSVLSPFVTGIFFSRDAWPAPACGGGYWEAPPFDPCGPWVAGDRLRPFFLLWAACLLWVLSSDTLRRGSSFPVFQQVLSGDLGTPFSPQWVGGCGQQGGPPGASGDFGARALSLERVRWAGWQPRAMSWE